MAAISVSNKGQVTIPKELRQRLGLRQGSKVEFVLLNGDVVMRVATETADEVVSGFGMLKSVRPALPADFDAATLLEP